MVAIEVTAVNTCIPGISQAEWLATLCCAVPCCAQAPPNAGQEWQRAVNASPSTSATSRWQTHHSAVEHWKAEQECHKHAQPHRIHGRLGGGVHLVPPAAAGHRAVAAKSIQHPTQGRAGVVEAWQANV
jgi:hypothetical protein